jgi:O-succinylbenzoate synthase
MIRFELKNISNPLKHSIKVGPKTLKERNIVILHLIDENGVRGSGELSPLPGLSKISLEFAKSVLEKFLKLELPKVNLNTPLFDKYLYGFSCMPVPVEVQFAFESAILDLLIKKKDAYTLRFFFFNSFSPPPVNILIDNLKHLESYQDINCIKIKIGRRKREDEIEFINKLIKKAPYSKLRLDGNRNFSVKEIINFAKKIDLASVEYFEEPFNVNENLKSIGNLNLRIAIDESFDNKRVNFPPGICAVVIKPSNYLSISGTISYINKTYIPTIISHCYNGDVGMNTLSLLAWYNNKILNLPGLHHGINKIS